MFEGLNTQYGQHKAACSLLSLSMARDMSPYASWVVCDGGGYQRQVIYCFTHTLPMGYTSLPVYAHLPMCSPYVLTHVSLCVSICGCGGRHWRPIICVMGCVWWRWVPGTHHVLCQVEVGTKRWWWCCGWHVTSVLHLCEGGCEGGACCWGADVARDVMCCYWWVYARDVSCVILRWRWDGQGSGDTSDVQA
jgi:hypothetical protein